MNIEEEAYLDVLRRLIAKAHTEDFHTERTGTGTVKEVGTQLRFDLSGGKVPALTTKKVFWRGAVAELLWMMSGSTNIKPLVDQNVHIWDEWATEEGELGPVYGAQWRNFCSPNDHLKHLTGVDQLQEVLTSLRSNPNSRRHVISAWNPTVLPDARLSPKKNAEMGSAALPPCHAFIQFVTEELSADERFDLIEKDWKAELGREDVKVLRDPTHIEDFLFDGKRYPKHRLSLVLTQRSADFVIGAPLNLVFYAAFCHLMAHQLNMLPGTLVWNGGDVHLYQNVVEQAELQVSREPRPFPTLKIKGNRDSIFDYQTSDFQLVGYDPHPAIKVQVSV